MTVLRLNTTEHRSPRRRIAYTGSGRRGDYSVFLSRQTRSMPAARRGVVTGNSHPLPAFSREGVRWDVLVITFALVLLLFLSVIIIDLSALYAGGSRIGKLSSGILSLEQSNDRLREEISLARIRAQSYELQKAADEEPERIVVLSPAPAE